MIVRVATAADVAHLERMLLHAVNWNDDREPMSLEAALEAPEIAHYIRGWPGRRDAGVVAAASPPDDVVGAAWWRHFALDDPGYGFVAPDIPEVTIGVDRAWRGRGVGRQLLATLHDLAVAHGLRRLSLSVENANDARSLYLSLGYEVVHDDGNASTMVVRLDG